MREAKENENLAALFGPRGIALGPNGSVYVADTGNKRVRVYDSDLNPISFFGGPGSDSGYLNEPVGIAIDKANRVYVADTGNGRIQRFSPDGKFEAEYPTLIVPEGEIISMEPNLAVLPDGRLAATYSNTGSIWLIDPERRSAVTFKIMNPEIKRPHGIVSDPDGALWVSDRESGVIAKVRAQ